MYNYIYNIIMYKYIYNIIMYNYIYIEFVVNNVSINISIASSSLKKSAIYIKYIISWYLHDDITKQLNSEKTLNLTCSLHINITNDYNKVE